MTPLRSYLPESDDLEALTALAVNPREGTSPETAASLALLASLTVWAVELSNRVDALPLDQLDKMASTLESHPLLRKLFGG